MGGVCSKCGGEGSYIEVLVGRPERRRPLGRHVHKWEYSNKTNFQEVGRGMDWIDLA